MLSFLNSFKTFFNSLIFLAGGFSQNTLIFFFRAFIVASAAYLLGKLINKISLDNRDNFKQVFNDEHSDENGFIQKVFEIKNHRIIILMIIKGCLTQKLN